MLTLRHLKRKVKFELKTILTKNINKAITITYIEMSLYLQHGTILKWKNGKEITHEVLPLLKIVRQLPLILRVIRSNFDENYISGLEIFK